MEETVKLQALTSDQEKQLVITKVEGRVRAEIDGRQYELEVHNADETSYLLLNNRRVFDCRVELAHKSRNRFEVSLKGHRHSVTIIDPRRLRTDENSDRHHHGPTEIAAQMPGKVVRVLVKQGTEVEKGAGIVVVEAMKMQNEMKTPRAGIVISVNVAAGDTVNAGDLLATVGE
jgi:biotin carboxyl carrier protein